ncbi:hypothetical protein ACJJI5_16735 [Microbulbifer sp. EKSA008]|uniref:hypothetical protein n=1 Tax=unclassified Microbulbifer TaxID=2619833 RepID=UPI0040391231
MNIKNNLSGCVVAIFIKYVFQLADIVTLPINGYAFKEYKLLALALLVALAYEPNLLLGISALGIAYVNKTDRSDYPGLPEVDI